MLRIVLRGQAAVLAMAGTLWSVALGAQTPLRDALAQCAQIMDITERVACYDQVAGAQSGPLPAASEAGSPPVQPEVAETTPPQWERQSAQDDGQSWPVASTIAALERVEPTKWRVELSNGQVWRQTVGKQFLLREGERVEIHETTWGDARRLHVDGRKGFIQVSRLQ